MPAPRMPTKIRTTTNKEFAQSGLPSPALSDGTISSPIRVDDLPSVSPRHHRKIQSGLPQYTAAVNPSTTQKPGVSTNTPEVFRQHPGPSFAGTRVRLPLGHDATIPAPQINSIPSAEYLAISQVPLNELMHRLQTLGTRIPAPGPAAAVENSRSNMIYNALRQKDSFCLVLHQLYCLKHIAPSRLPVSVRQMKPATFDILEVIIAPNTQINPHTIMLWADFPEPLMDIYSNASSKVRDEYEKVVQFVKRFLLHISEVWSGLMTTAKQLCSPPLVQDMVDVLGLYSPILQTIVFRAIARSLWRTLGPQGAIALEALHQTDQRTYYEQHYRRTEKERELAYGAFRNVFHLWVAQQNNPAVSKDPLPPTNPHNLVPLPPDVIAIFHGPPQSMLVRPLQSGVAPLVAIPQIQRDSVSGHTTPRTTQPSILQRPFDGNPWAQASHQPPAQIQPTPTAVPPLQRSTAPAQSLSYNMAFNVPPKAQTTVPSTVPGQEMPNLVDMRHQNSQSEKQPQLNIRIEEQPKQPDPLRSALHQAHLRSPKLVPHNLQFGNRALSSHVVGYSLPLTQLDNKFLIQSISLEIPKEAYQNLPEVRRNPDQGEPPQYVVQQDTHTYRLRCAKLPPGGFTSENAWKKTPTRWPDEMFLEFNRRALEMRRRCQHGRDLSVDLTPFIQEGTNTLKVFMNRPRLLASEAEYVIAIEVVGYAGDKRSWEWVPGLRCFRDTS